MPHGLGAGQPKRTCGSPLAFVHAVDAGAKYFCHVCAVGEAKRNRAPDQGRIPWALQANARNTKPHQINPQDDGHAAHDVGVGNDKHTHGEESRVASAARNGDEHCSNQDAWCRPRKDLDV